MAELRIMLWSLLVLSCFPFLCSLFAFILCWLLYFSITYDHEHDWVFYLTVGLLCMTLVIVYCAACLVCSYQLQEARLPQR